MIADREQISQASDGPPLPGSAGRGAAEGGGEGLLASTTSPFPTDQHAQASPPSHPLSSLSPTTSSSSSPDILLRHILRSDTDLANLLDQTGITASQLIRLARTADFKHDLADLQALIFTAARIRAIQNLSRVASASDDLVEQRRASTAILRATSPALTAAASSPSPTSDRASSPTRVGEDVRRPGGQVRASTPNTSTSSPIRHSPLPIRPIADGLLPIASSLPTHSAPDLLEHLIGKLQDPDDYADELEEDLDDDDLDEERDTRDYALLALHAAFTHSDSSRATASEEHPPPPGEVAHAPLQAEHETEGASSPSSSASSSPTPNTPLPTPASFDGSPVPSDPSAFLSLIDADKRDDLTDFAAAQRSLEEDEPTLYTERICFAHSDGRDVFRRFTFQRADSTSPWRLTLVEPYDPEDIDPSDGYDDADDDSDTS